MLTEGLYFADGQVLVEVYVYGSFTQSNMHRDGVRFTIFTGRRARIAISQVPDPGPVIERLRGRARRLSALPREPGQHMVTTVRDRLVRPRSKDSLRCGSRQWPEQ